MFHALHRLSGHEVPPTMANTVNLVNANALLEVRPGGLVRSATWHVWNLLQRHTGPVVLRTETESPGRTSEIRRDPVPSAHGDFPTRPGFVPWLDVTASRSEARDRLSVSVINRHATRAIATRILLDEGATPLPGRATVHAIGTDTDDLFASNTMDDPDAVSVRDRGEVAMENGEATFPPHSITVLTFSL